MDISSYKRKIKGYISPFIRYKTISVKRSGPIIAKAEIGTQKITGCYNVYGAVAADIISSSNSTPWSHDRPYQALDNRELLVPGHK